MGNVKDRLDEISNQIMSGLKNFQKATVERIATLYEGGTNRVLVSDEVGLGKTLIARGVIAKFAQLVKEGKIQKANKDEDIIKVVYVCSNAAISQQNLNNLKIADEVTTDGISDSRLSMQHLKIAQQDSNPDIKKNYIQLIPLTPATSFNITNSQGLAQERALMYAILRRIDWFKDHDAKLEELMICGAKTGWKEWWCKDYYENQVAKLEETKGEYPSKFVSAVETELFSEGSSLGDELLEMITDYEQGKYRESKTRLIVKLRTMFAKLSLRQLQPDLIIMDEFQRFKDLLKAEGNSDADILKKEFIDNKSNARILLLSATPYKMYSTLDEIEEAKPNEYYQEFLDVLNFLNATPQAQSKFNDIWEDYSVQLKEYALGNQTAVLQAKNKAEDALYSHICRTERIAAEDAVDIIDDSSVTKSLDISEADVKSYIEMNEVLRLANDRYNVPNDFVKSSPYLLSFMKDYKLRRIIEDYFKNNNDKLDKLETKGTCFINVEKLAQYEEIPCNNARLECLMKYLQLDKQNAQEQNVELLLWVPPTKPYYEPTYPFDKAQNFTKTLIFSYWEMVPRMLASLISYEVERRTIGKLAKERENKDIKYFENDLDDDSNSGKKRLPYPLPKLNFALKGDNPAAMSLFCLIYPSKFLAESFKPIDCLNEKLSLEEITQKVKGKISSKLSDYPNVEDGKEDRRWYYVAPLLLDGCEYREKYVKSLQESIKRARERIKESRNKQQAKKQDDEKVYDEKYKLKGYMAHCQRLAEICESIIKDGSLELGRRPEDLEDVLADMAIASPSICAYRSYQNYFDSQFDYAYPTETAVEFIDRMNKPEATAVIEWCFGKDETKKEDQEDTKEEAFWRNVLLYCKAGNYQAMFDEYMHLITNGVRGRDKKSCESAHNNIIQSFAIRTTTYEVDTFDSFDDRMRGFTGKKKVRMRSHFAVAFAEGDGGVKDSDRKKVLRNAFNSPFRPFVLASTSIGQEGLDFHNYCRRIVHWNLPSNPIDLEQREGRINRYECLAIRQNIANRYGRRTDFQKDIWKEMFAQAEREECQQSDSQLVPYWALKKKDGMPELIKIERIVPMYPFSRDEPSYERLMKILNLYRLTLGQARQEELLDYVIKNHSDDENLKDMFINLSPYYKEPKK